MTSAVATGTSGPATGRPGAPQGETGDARPGRAAGANPWFRPDIEGMRAVAVLLVVLSHAGVSALGGGYVGVDVFFVISGFLITTLLLREVLATGRISILGFYARRAVRLLPASSLVLVATLAGAWLWLSPIRFTGYAKDAVAAAGYAVNIRLAQTGTDYLAADGPPSPFQHFWSLAVEEQFYFVWPLLILAAVALGRRRRGRVDPGAAWPVLVVLTLGSFTLSVLETQRSAPWAYFGAHTRAWELGLGAMLALGAVRLRRLPAPLAAAFTWVGLAAIGVAAVWFDAGTAFPGYAAALPVLGAVLVIAGGGADPAPYGAGRLLSARPLQVIGRLSYGWYLWHWPVLLIAPAALNIEAGVGTNLLLCAAALGLAAVSLRLLEQPIRHRRPLLAVPRRGVALGATLSVTTAALALLASTAPPSIASGPPAPDLRAAVDQSADPAAVLADFVDTGHRLDELPGNVTPSPVGAGGDRPVVFDDGCHLSYTTVVAPGPCAYGDQSADTTVVLFGDSHAAHWFPALERLANTHRWKLVSLTKSGCSPADVRQHSGPLKRAYTECDEWRDIVLADLERQPPDLVVTASGTHDRRLLGGGPQEQQWREGWARTFGTLRAAGSRVATIADTPFFTANVPDCVAEHTRQVHRCAEPAVDVLLGPAQRAIIAAEAGRHGATVVDPVPWLCADRCPAVIGDVLVYRDSNHLTTVYSAALAPVLRLALPALPSD